jgi:hypothetical protein
VPTPASWGAAATGKQSPTLYLQETDHFTIRIHQDSAQRTTTLSANLGVGRDAPDGKEGVFDVTVTDSTPADDKWLSGRGNPWQVKTIYGKPFAIPWSAKTSNGRRTISFPLKGVPYLGESGASCCGCGDEGTCGRGCAVEWSYKVEPNIQPAGWGDVSYLISPSRLIAGQDNAVTVTVTAAGGKLQQAWVRLHVPPKQASTTVRIDKFPESLQQRRCSCGAMVVDGKLGAQPTTVSVQLTITPSDAGSLVLKDIVQAGGKLNRLTYPRASVQPKQEVSRTEATSVTYSGDLAFHVQPK